MIETFSPPTTYDQWSALLDARRKSPSKELAAVLRHGSVDAFSAMPVLDMVRRYCEDVLNRETRRLEASLEAYNTDADAVALICTRYSADCERLLFFADVPGLPAPQVGQLAGEIRRYVSTVLGAVADAGESPQDDVWVVIQRLRRRWSSR
ncbi:hypothetical protein JS530_00725 [Bifidobacterium sp. LC6]|uniref:Uncharacterized protein n=1 Tax=Bifidobacterium colobi TaxID=2809026 RepID=A0ABS5USX5_9BIFI|nr:hypothetical protein [Bifidobacterium colobi]MBT1174055.1 hypothetical protein [Bifidobacterium colobi]